MTQKLNLYTCTGFTGHYPVGTSAIIIAPSEERARLLLDQELKKYGLGRGDGEKHNMFVVPLDKQAAIILNDGDY
jgi:hypothetical protein